MRIEAAGKTWIVEEQELDRDSWAGGDRFSEVTFRNADYDFDQLHVSWVLSPECLTPRLAQELFEIAGVRHWRDPRDARAYRLHLETVAKASSRPGRPASVEAIRFHVEGDAFQAPWTLGKPLGWASDAELMALLDRALEDATAFPD